MVIKLVSVGKVVEATSMAMQNESHPVKAALPIIPMISDYVFSFNLKILIGILIRIVFFLSFLSLHIAFQISYFTCQTRLCQFSSLYKVANI
jgi:hypothetical protein